MTKPDEIAIPDISHGRADSVHVNFFWPVKIFTDLTRKIGVFRCKFYSPKILCTTGHELMCPSSWKLYVDDFPFLVPL